MVVLSPNIDYKIKLFERRMITDQINPWLFHFKSGTLSISRFDGRKITVGGCIEFSDSTRQVFWQNYIEPFLEDFTVTIIKSIENECLKSDLNLDDHLKYLSVALPKMYNIIYSAMSEVDQQLRGHGYPKKIQRQEIKGYLGGMERFLEDHLEMVMQKNFKDKKVKNNISKIWKDPVWSKVIGTAITGILGYLLWWCFPD